MSAKAEWELGVGARVRAMERADLGVILEIERACFAVPWSERTFRGLLGRPDAALLVAERLAADGLAARLQGYAAVWVAGGEAELGNLAVRPSARRSGVGSALLRAALNEARQLGARAVFLEVRASNEAARRLYAGAGFHTVGRRAGYYRRPMEDALVLRRSLELGVR